MTQIVEDIKAENAVLVTKVDALMVAFVAQGTQITALQAQVADLLANGSIGPADAAALQDVLTSMRAEVDKVTTVLPAQAAKAGA